MVFSSSFFGVIITVRSTEYENLKEATEMRESVSGKYGGVGMIISGLQDLTKTKFEQQLKSLPSSLTPPSTGTIENDQESQKEITAQLAKLQNRGVVVVDAFEGYAYDNNIR